jgi:hypothetical protein
LDCALDETPTPPKTERSIVRSVLLSIGVVRGDANET